MSRRPSVPYDVQKVILKEYSAGATRTELCDKYNITHGVLSGILVKLNRDFPEARGSYTRPDEITRIWNENIELIEQMVYEGANNQQIADAVEGLSISTTASRRKNAGLPSCTEVRNKAKAEGIALKYYRDNRATDPNLLERIRELNANGTGMSDPEISAIIGVTAQTVGNIRRAHGIPKVPQRYRGDTRGNLRPHAKWDSIDGLDIKHIPDDGWLNLLHGIVELYASDLTRLRNGGRMNGTTAQKAKSYDYKAEVKYTMSKECRQYMLDIASVIGYLEEHT